jgi:hypothetical protein
VNDKNLRRVLAPIKPTAAQLITSNATVITLWLDTWADGGCPILYFSVEYRHQNDWLLASANVQPSERVFSIADLRAATRYMLRVTAYNNAGSTQAFYNVTMAPLGGELDALNTPPPRRY